MQVSGSIITIPAITLPDGSLSKAVDLDLAGRAGQAVRIYVDADGLTYINPARDMYWQVAELVIPPACSGMDDEGNPTPPPPLDLATITITAFTLPEA